MYCVDQFRCNTSGHTDLHGGSHSLWPYVHVAQYGALCIVLAWRRGWRRATTLHGVVYFLSPGTLCRCERCSQRTFDDVGTHNARRRRLVVHNDDSVVEAIIVSCADCLTHFTSTVYCVFMRAIFVGSLSRSPPVRTLPRLCWYGRDYYVMRLNIQRKFQNFGIIIRFKGEACRSTPLLW